MITSTTDAGDALREFRAPRTMTPDELGDSLARLVWESFSDFLAESGTERALMGLLASHGEVSEQAAEEALVFFMWAHTRGAQLAFIGRAGETVLRRGLDAMHRAVFEDMVQHGTPASHLPIFEQRVAARYAEYSRAAQRSNARLGRAVVRHLMGGDAVPETPTVRAVVERALGVANPLSDFLQEVELIEAGRKGPLPPIRAT